MFNKEGIPFFIIVIPFLSILLISFLSISYYLKLSNETYQIEINEYIKIKEKIIDTQNINDFLEVKIKEHEKQQQKFKKFLFTATSVIIIFMILFTFLMLSIIKDVVKKYKKQVQNRENELKNLNDNLSLKVKQGIEEAKQKDRKILEQAKLARIGSMISMIAHQWR